MVNGWHDMCVKGPDGKPEGLGMRRRDIKRPDLARLDHERSKRVLMVFLACALAWLAIAYALLHVF